MFGKDKKEKRFVVKERESSSDGSIINIVVDKNTGVNYLMLSGIGLSITPLLDSNGKIVIDK